MKEILLKILGWTSEIHTIFQTKVGRQFLQEKIGHDPFMVDEILSDPLYWKWWREEWNIRDTAFTMTRYLPEGQSVFDVYYTIHDPYLLASEMDTQNIYNKYAEMMGRLIDKHTKK